MIPKKRPSAIKRAIRKLTFDSGHRLKDHEGKCAFLHGHTYRVHLVAQGELDSIGRVIDFGLLKSLFQTWINTMWDHGFILNEADEEGQRAMVQIKGQKVFLLPYNPSAENIALYLLEVVGPDLLEGTGVRLVKVIVQETENCTAEAEVYV